MPRKKKADSLAEVMEIPEVERVIKGMLPTLISRMFDLALGVVVVEERFDEDSGEVIQRAYRQIPDRQALAYLIDNVIGKVPQRVELTGKGGGPMEVTPWAPIAAMRAAGLLKEGEDIVDGVLISKTDLPVEKVTPEVTRG